MESTAIPRNFTTPDNERNLSWAALFSIVSYSLVFVLGTVGNGLVIFITGFRMKRTVHTVWILSLAIADFTFSFFQLFNIGYIGLKFHWPFGDAMCKLQHAIVFFNLFASIYLLTAINIDRCVSMWFPVWAQNHRMPRLASFVILGICILALMLCSPHLYFKEISYKKNIISCSNNYSKLGEARNSARSAVVLVRFIFGFIIPFGVIVVCYGAIVVRLKRNQLTHSSKPFKVITAVIVAFFVCWFPFHVFYLLRVKTSYGPRIRIGLSLSFCLAYFNSCLNCMGSFWYLLLHGASFQGEVEMFAPLCPCKCLHGGEQPRHEGQILRGAGVTRLVMLTPSFQSSH
ncbi:hypothetical protein lerEdw1_009747 [Lerista edwardsae]|nr:hypothetical protein lerEdw1_009747 [Lerista edwardsae]